MKKNSRHRGQFNMYLNEEDQEVVRKLRDEYQINVSGCVKHLLRQKLAEQEKVKQI